MSATQAVITYFCLWWVVWIAALPFGVKAVENPPEFHDPGAPEKPHLLPKFIATTLLSLALTLGIMWALNSGLLSLHVDEDIFY